jgi:hypothetical protein
MTHPYIDNEKENHNSGGDDEYINKTYDDHE